MYRVALHTAMGLLATGTAEGTLSTGAVASVAPKLNEIQVNLKEKLTKEGFEESAADIISQSALSLALAGIGTSAGFNTASTAYVVNTDVNNRQLHENEIDIIKIFAQDYAKEKGISIQEAERLLTRGVLYNIDSGWAVAYLNHEQTNKEIDQYQEAYGYLRGKTLSYHDLKDSSEVLLTDILTSHTDTLYVTIKDKPYANIKTAFTASAKDYNNQRLFLKESFDTQTSQNLNFILQNAAIYDPLQYRYTKAATNARIEGTNQGFKSAFKDLLSTENSAFELGQLLSWVSVLVRQLETH